MGLCRPVQEQVEARAVQPPSTAKLAGMILVEQPRSHFGDDVDGEMPLQKNLILLVVLWYYYAAKHGRQWQAAANYGNQLWNPPISDLI